MKPEAVVRKIRQHDADILDIYQMLADIQATQATHSSRFDTLDTRLDGVETKVDSILDLLRSA
jgi:hypothetical protein